MAPPLLWKQLQTSFLPFEFRQAIYLIVYFLWLFLV